MPQGSEVCNHIYHSTPGSASGLLPPLHWDLGCLHRQIHLHLTQAYSSSMRRRLAAAAAILAGCKPRQTYLPDRRHDSRPWVKGDMTAHPMGIVTSCSVERLQTFNIGLTSVVSLVLFPACQQQLLLQTEGPLTGRNIVSFTSCVWPASSLLVLLGWIAGRPVDCREHKDQKKQHDIRQLNPRHPDDL